MLKDILNQMAPIGVQAIKDAVQVVSATGKTEKSIHYVVKQEGTELSLQIFARKFFGTIETGRGPRKSGKDSGFADSMLEYMNARNIGTDLSPKKRKQLAKFLAYRINKEGDKTFKAGGRLVYSPVLLKFISELKVALIKDYKKTVLMDIIAVANQKIS